MVVVFELNIASDTLNLYNDNLYLGFKNTQLHKSWVKTLLQILLFYVVKMFSIIYQIYQF